MTTDSENPGSAVDGPAGWKWTLYALMALQALSILVFALETFLHVSLPLPFAVSSAMTGALSVVGTLLWCSESALPRPHLTRLGIRSILIGGLLWVVCVFFMPFRGSRPSPEREADARRAFQKLVAEAKLPAPASEPDFSAASRHGEGFSLRYTDTSEAKQHFLVRTKFTREWVFRSPANPAVVTTPASY